MAKQTKVITHVPALNARVKKIVTAFGGVEKAQTKLGDVVLEVAATLTQQDIAPFCTMLKTQLEAANPGKESSIKVQVSYIRRVVTAIVVDGVEVEPGQSLRGIYDSLPKKATGGAKHGKKGAQLPNPGAEEPEATKEKPTTLADRAEKVKAAITMIFGYCEPDLLDAVRYSAANIPAFLAWAADHSQAAQLAELEKVITAAPTKASRPRKQKAAVAVN